MPTKRPWAEVLCAALKRDEFDLILFGIKAIDDDSGQIGILVAEKLGLPHVSTITKLDLGEGSLTAEREIEGRQGNRRRLHAGGADLPEGPERGPACRACRTS